MPEFDRLAQVGHQPSWWLWLWVSVGRLNEVCAVWLLLMPEFDRLAQVGVG